MARLKQKQIRVGDTLQVFAARELDDIHRWRELAELNGLRPPYLVASLDEADRLPRTLLWGDWVSLPALAAEASAALGEDALGVDARVEGGDLAVTAGGDIDIVTGLPNFVQALRHRVLTPYASFWPHPDYGCEIHALLGLGNGPAMSVMGAGLVRRALLRDPRTASASAVGAADGDRLRVRVEAQAVNAETASDINILYHLPR
jgi:phage baseplate assembly protein W